MPAIGSDRTGKCIESLYHCTVDLVDAASLSVDLRGGLKWTGDIYTYDLDKAGKARRAYAWWADLGGPGPELFVLFQSGRIRSPADAIHSAAEAGYRLRDDST
jgi:hypothetical protein